MDIWDANKLVLFIAFVIPGFVSIKCYQLAFPGSARPMSDLIVDAVAYSSINYAVLSPLLVLALDRHWLATPTSAVAICLFVLLLAPMLWVWLWRYLRTREFFQRAIPHPIGLPWDFVFRQRECYWVKVVLKDGTVVAGRYAERSFASSAPAGPQLYLEETWLLNPAGGFLRKKNETRGVLIITSDISHIEFRHDAPQPPGESDG